MEVSSLSLACEQSRRMYQSNLKSIVDHMVASCNAMCTPRSLVKKRKEPKEQKKDLHAGVKLLAKARVILCCLKMDHSTWGRDGCCQAHSYYLQVPGGLPKHRKCPAIKDRNHFSGAAANMGCTAS